MFLKDLAKIIYTEGTESKNRHITVMVHGDGSIVWTGKAEDLAEYANKHNWIVVEIHINYTDMSTDVDINKGKIIIVT